MATNTNTETMADQIAMALGGGLIILGVVVFGILETLSGEPTSPIAVLDDGSRVVADGVLIPPAIRSWVVIAGILVLGLFALYAFATQQHLAE